MDRLRARLMLHVSRKEMRGCIKQEMGTQTEEEIDR